MENEYQHRKPKCSCGKICFDKKAAATKRNFLLRQGDAKCLWIYQCPLSNTWHLTKSRARS